MIIKLTVSVYTGPVDYDVYQLPRCKQQNVLCRSMLKIPALARTTKLSAYIAKM